MDRHEVTGIESTGRAALVDATTVALATTSAVLLFGRGVNPAWLLLGGGVVGMIAGR